MNFSSFILLPFQLKIAFFQIQEIFNYETDMRSWDNNSEAAVVSILLYGCTTWMLTERIVKTLNRICSRILRGILNKSWKQNPAKQQQLYEHLLPIFKTIQIRRTRHAGHCWRNEDELISDILIWTSSHNCASN